MIKKSLYPKTKRVSCTGDTVYLTEKLDGSNLVFFKKDNKLYISQRNNIICIDELETSKDVLYKGLYQWLLDNKDVLVNELHDNSAICGEWLGMAIFVITIFILVVIGTILLFPFIIVLLIISIIAMLIEKMMNKN